MAICASRLAAYRTSTRVWSAANALLADPMAELAATARIASNLIVG